MTSFIVTKDQAPFHFKVVDGLGSENVDVKAYLQHLVTDCRSPYTLRSYAYGLAHFHTWLGKNELASVTPEKITAYISDWCRQEKPPAPSTSNHRLSILSGYFEFFLTTRSNSSEWRNRVNPVPSVKRAMRQSPLRKWHRYPRADLRRRIPRRVHRYITEQETVKLSAFTRNCRDRALLSLLEWSGQRIGDWSGIHGRHGILGLKLGDIDQKNRTISVYLKGARDLHTVPVGEAFWPLYRKYLQLERKVQNHDAVWVSLRSGKGKALSYATFETAFRALCRRAGIKGVSAHSFRHTFAQNLLETTDNLALVQAFLAHSSPETTASTYVQVSMQRMVSAIQQFEIRKNTQLLTEGGGEYLFDYDPTSVGVLEDLFQGVTDE